MAFTVGADLNFSLGNRLGIIVPVRVTQTWGEQQDRSPGPTIVHGGVGLRWWIFRYTN